MSRHRDGAALHYGRDDFANEGQLRRTLARERPKEMALDYEPRGSVPPRSVPTLPRSASTSDRTEVPREERGGVIATVQRALGLSEPGRAAEAASTSEPALVMRARRGDERPQPHDRFSGPGKRAEAGQASAPTPTNSERANELRAMVAARNTAPKPTVESVRQALAAAKAAPSAERDRDHGAER